jgi:hypothetical protein
MTSQKPTIVPVTSLPETTNNAEPIAKPGASDLTSDPSTRKICG